jgi:lipopolysaccharide/colanic/teichoic acid biosynthesis glycosyltransferase
MNRFTRHDRFARIFSTLAVTAGGMLLAPALATVAVGIRVFIGKPVLFSQIRIGKNSKPFRIVKFRTMSEAKDAEGRLLPDEQRLGAFGKLLRSTSLDEFPEFWNILKGEMNLVGPRPLLPEYLPLYSERQARRHEVLPGLTGWNAVNGRNNNTWEEQLEMDIWYIDNRSVLLDFKILAMTVVKVLQRDGARQDNHATRARFQGNSGETKTASAV